MIKWGNFSNPQWYLWYLITKIKKPKLEDWIHDQMKAISQKYFERYEFSKIRCFYKIYEELPKKKRMKITLY